MADIDPPEFSAEWFDLSSQAWRANKKAKANGAFVYGCEHICSNAKPCKKEVFKTSKYCKYHLLKHKGETKTVL